MRHLLKVNNAEEVIRKQYPIIYYIKSIDKVISKVKTKPMYGIKVDAFTKGYILVNFDENSDWANIYGWQNFKLNGVTKEFNGVTYYGYARSMINDIIYIPYDEEGKYYNVNIVSELTSEENYTLSEIIIQNGKWVTEYDEYPIIEGDTIIDDNVTYYGYLIEEIIEDDRTGYEKMYIPYKDNGTYTDVNVINKSVRNYYETVDEIEVFKGSKTAEVLYYKQNIGYAEVFDEEWNDYFSIPIIEGNIITINEVEYQGYQDGNQADKIIYIPVDCEGHYDNLTIYESVGGVLTQKEAKVNVNKFNYKEQILYANNEVTEVHIVDGGDFPIPNNLTNIILPNNVNEVWNFRGTPLMSITLPDNLTYIGDYAFEYCTILTSITYKGVTYVSDGTQATKENVTAFFNALSDNGVELGKYPFNRSPFDL